ncbi:MAG: response regulator [Candidatus Marsarchaeota archaeon]|jgi:DNA-binding response OmpR family regulator|nr:response regulator [Candidatus Marsarchaeota archaeon]MCL5418345.1 response regulator [Candidatus Marsarchaeota archaeon]
MDAGATNAREGADFVLNVLNDRQQVTYSELSGLAFSRGLAENSLKQGLAELAAMKVIASRSSGGILTYYMLQQEKDLRKVLIVEDDKNINKLMAISIGKDFEINQLYDGAEAVPFMRKSKQDLVILDLMLPHKDGLDICQTIKSDPELSNTIVIIVSAMDPTSNRFKGIKYGADYYIKKPFEPADLRNLVTLFLKKKGKRFDPLIDLPDEERLTNEIEHSIKEDSRYTIGSLKVNNLGDYAKKFGERSAMVILRLISQLLQDIISTKVQNVFVGFLNSEMFMVAGLHDDVLKAVDEVKQEFSAVLPFILQDEGYRMLDLDIDNLFDSNEVPKLTLTFEVLQKEKIKERREEILRSKGDAARPIGAYTYDELQKLFGDKDLDVKITRDSSGVKLQVGKGDDKDEA